MVVEIISSRLAAVEESDLLARHVIYRKRVAVVERENQIAVAYLHVRDTRAVQMDSVLAPVVVGDDFLAAVVDEKIFTLAARELVVACAAD